MTVQATFAATLVDEWARGGVTDAVLAPGSRSTPLAIALARDARLQVRVFLDERAAGFFALGLGAGTGRPAVVVTTSGTAAAELHPAIVEAHHARVPMIACTADRPPELQQTGAPQTIEQPTMFGGAPRWTFDPGVADEQSSGVWRPIASRAVLESTCHPCGPGPVHLNLAFRDPLIGDPNRIPDGRPDGRPWHATVKVSGLAEPPRGVLDRLSGRRGVVVAGGGASASVHRLAAALRWPVLADATSGLRGRGRVVAAFDGLLRDPDFAAAHRPEVVLRFGRLPASKVLSEWLASSGADEIVVDPYWTWNDPQRTAALIVHSEVRAFCDVAAATARPAKEDWAAAWYAAEEAAQQAIDVVLSDYAEPTEPGIARALSRIKSVPTVFVSSSMPVRDLEWYGDPGSCQTVLANRGANGIDGVVSTALGVAAGAGQPVVVLLGDLAFLHDAGGLLWAGRRKLDCTFVVVDNDGGGIFSFLPQASWLEEPTFETLFATPHALDLPAIAAAYGLGSVTVERSAQLLPAVEGCVAAGGVHVIIVRTDRHRNVAVHERINDELAAAPRSVTGGRRPPRGPAA